MNSKFTIVACALLLTACGNRTSSIEKEYIQNLEEKNAILEQEIEALRNSEPPENHVRPKKSGNVSQFDESNTKLMEDSNKAANDYDPNFFTIGSTEEEVLRVMGDPTSISGSKNNKWFWYDMDYVIFQDGRVERYSNQQGNLRLRVSR
jgi:hypothetical protein